MQKVYFIRVWPSPPIAKSIEAVLRKAFPEYELEIIDIARILKKRPGILLRNTLAVVRYYGLDILRGIKTFKESFWYTPYLFNQIGRLLPGLIDSSQAALTFQLQSLFDASQPGLPHYVYTDHTHLANLDYPDFDRRKLYHRSWIDLEESIYHKATLVFTRSTNIARSLVRQYGLPPHKAVCVYAGSNAPVVGQPVSPEGSNGRAKNILFVGADWERKGGPDLLEAFRAVLSRHPDARLTIVGSSPEVHEPQVNVVGYVPVDQLDRYYRQADIFCLPTRREPFGIVFVEALSYRLPLVATDIGAIPDMVVHGKNGYLVAPGDVHGLSQALDDLLSDAEKRSRFGEYSYRLATERYNWDAVAKAIRENVMIKS
ncbi:MAG: glycosyltransferase family 1 protein [Chloroflexota bacterium]|nr:MAG: glycosyltransferase family 1 protein [Chloroflexota bacterium]